MSLINQSQNNHLHDLNEVPTLASVCTSNKAFDSSTKELSHESVKKKKKLLQLSHCNVSRIIQYKEEYKEFKMNYQIVRFYHFNENRIARQ